MLFLSWWKIKLKVLACSLLKLLTYFENPSSNPLHKDPKAENVFTVSIHPGWVRSMTVAPCGPIGFSFPRLLAPAKMMVCTFLDSIAFSYLAAKSLARMPSGFEVIEKPLHSETVRERRSSWAVCFSDWRCMTGWCSEWRRSASQIRCAGPGWMEATESLIQECQDCLHLPRRIEEQWYSDLILQ